MPPNRTERVNVPLTESEKKKWESATGDDERFSSQAELARTSVYRELEGYHENNRPGGGSGSDALVEPVEKISGRIGELISKVEDIDTRLDRLEGKVTASGPEMDLENIIYDLLPNKPEEGRGSTVADLADRYGFGKAETRRALERLERRTDTVAVETPRQQGFGIPGEDDNSQPRFFYRADGGGR